MDMTELYDDASKALKMRRILFRGFCLERSKDSVIIKDIRNTYYKRPKDEDLQIIMDNGFVVGTTMILMESDKKKIERYKKLKDNQIRLSKANNINPRKLQEHKNSINRYELEINYYESQVNRWQQFIKHNSI